MISAFGDLAKLYATGLGDMDAVITTPEHVPHAYMEALRRRERGELCYGMILSDDPRVTLAYNAAASIIAQVPDIDLRRRAFDGLAAGTLNVDGRPAKDVWNDQPMHLVQTEFFRVTGAMLVRSYAEFASFAQRSALFTRPVERVLVEPKLPVLERIIPDIPTVVVWAPRRTATNITLLIGGLWEFRGDVIYIVGDATGAPPGFSVVTPGDPGAAAALERAGCIVCAEPNDPGDAVAFARLGYGIVAPMTSGAYEFVPEVVPWDAGSANMLHHAVVKALGRPAAVRTPYVAPPRTPAVPGPPMPSADLPLVSIIIPTYNRPKDLRAVLTAVAAQTYPAVEAIVVNDCGSPVEDVVADFPFAKLVNHKTNAGAVKALETGMEHAAGDYIEFLPDDDLIYPDHVERVMFAMLRSGAKLAHGNGMLRYVERTADGDWKMTGVNGTLCGESLNPNVASIATPVSENAVIHHRSVFSEAGWLLADSALNDLELHMRYGNRYVFVHSDAMTFEFREHPGNQAKTLDFPTELERLYRDVHPMPGRPILAEDRRSTLEAMRRRVPGQPAFPPTITIG
jgi:hypothetical protein